MKKSIAISLMVGVLLMTACQQDDAPQSQIDATIPSQIENQDSEQEAVESELVHRLNEFIEIDVENVLEFEHAIIYYGPYIVESVTKFTQQEAKDMAKQLSQLVVISDGNISLYTAGDGSTIRYTLNFSNGTEPLVIYYSNTFTPGSIEGTPVCYIDRDYYKDVHSSNVVDIVFPENSKSVLYDIVNGQRVERTK